MDRGSTIRKAAVYTQNERSQISMPQLGFEPTIQVFEWAKEVHALDRAAAVIGGMLTDRRQKSNTPKITFSY
jgi:hypothetical protein